MPQIMFAGDLEARCALLAGLGYDGIDMFSPIRRHGCPYAKAALDRNGLRATMLAAQGDLMVDGLYLNDAGRLSELLERSKYHLEQCAVLGAMPNIVHPGMAPQRSGQPAPHGGRPRRVLSTGGVLRCGRALGTDLPLRNRLHPYNGSGHRPVRACRKTRQSRALLDLFHMNIEEASVCGAICRAGSLVRHVHFVDNTRAVPGMGCMALSDVVACLKAVGYEGFLGIEAIPGSDPEGEARRRPGLHPRAGRVRLYPLANRRHFSFAGMFRCGIPRGIPSTITVRMQSCFL